MTALMVLIAMYLGAAHTQMHPHQHQEDSEGCKRSASPSWCSEPAEPSRRSSSTAT